MGRLIGAVLLGYLIMGFAVSSVMYVVYLLVDADSAFRPGTYEVSAVWIMLNIAIGFGAALLGGWVCRQIARRAEGPRMLAGVVAVLGLALALTAGTRDAPESGIRFDATRVSEAAAVARTPFWLMLLNPVIGAIGVLMGGRALRSEESQAPVVVRDRDTQVQ